MISRWPRMRSSTKRSHCRSERRVKLFQLVVRQVEVILIGGPVDFFSPSIAQNDHCEFDWKKFFLSNAPTLAFWLRDSNIDVLWGCIGELTSVSA